MNPPAKLARHRRALGMLLLAPACWAVSFPVMKALGLEQQKLWPDIDSWFFTSLSVMYRFGASALLLALFLGRHLKKLTRLEVEQGIGMSLFGVGGILFQMDGLAYTAASTSAFLTQCYVLFIPLWVAITRRSRPSLQVVLCVLIVVAGLAILSGQDFGTLKLGRGEVETLIASVFFTCQILLLEHPRYAANDALSFSVVMFAGMTLLCMPIVVLTAPSATACLSAYASPAAAGLLAVLVLLCTLCGYLLMNRWQRSVTATEAGMIYCIEPVIASLLALVLPRWISAWAKLDYANETLTTRLLIGGSLVTIANLLLQKVPSTRNESG